MNILLRSFSWRALAGILIAIGVFFSFYALAIDTTTCTASNKATCGNATISKNGITIKTTARLGGAIDSLQWNGKEFVDSYDHGRQIQTAWTANGLGQCFNPTEAGSAADGTGPTTTSNLLKIVMGADSIVTTGYPAFWLEPGRYDSGCNFNTTPPPLWKGGTAANTTKTSTSLLEKSITIGHAGISNVIEYQSKITLSQAELNTVPLRYMVLINPAVYMPTSFTNAYRYNPRTSKLTTLPTIGGHSSTPGILSTADGKHAIALYTNEIPWAGFPTNEQKDYAGYAFNTYGGQVSSMNTRTPKTPPTGSVFTAGTYTYRTFMVVGTLADVQASLNRLYALYPPANSGPIGSLDTVDGIIKGWAFDYDHPNDPINVHIYIDGPAGQGVFVGVTSTSILRSDVNQKYELNGTHGFAFQIPQHYKDGKSHSVYVYGIDPDDGPNPLLTYAPQTFTITQIITLGPKMGEIQSTKAKVWVRTNGTRKVSILYRKQGIANFTSTPSITTDGARDFTVVAALAGLQANTLYEYKVQADGADATQLYMFKTPSSEGAPGKFAFAVGADMYHGQRPFSIFNNISQKKPLFSVLNGDLMYADGGTVVPDTIEGYRERWRTTWDDLAFQNFGTQIPMFTTWDDHEILNDWSAGKTGRYLNASKAFKEYGAAGNPAPRKSGELYYSFSMGQADFYVIDSRSFRSPNGAADDSSKTMLGATQKADLKNWLLASKAKFKFIVSSVMWNDFAPSGDSWDAFLTERGEIFNFIKTNNVKGVLLISGDRHWMMVAKLNAISPDHYLYEFSPSPLGIRTMPGSLERPEVLFTYNKTKNYGLFTVDTTVTPATVTFGAYGDADDNPLYNLTVKETDIDPLVSTESQSITHGPKIGDAQSNLAKIWLRTNGAKNVSVLYRKQGAVDFSATPSVTTKSTNDFTSVASLSGLQSSTLYEYKVAINGVDATPLYTFKTLPSRGVPGIFSFALGADISYEEKSNPVFDNILQKNPAFSLFLGDIIYADTGSLGVVPDTIEGYRERWRVGMSDTSLQNLGAKIPLFTIWDDHEIQNDWSAGKTGRYFNALQSFKEYNTANPAPRVNGEIYYSFSAGEADFYVLDTRSYRSPNGAADDSSKTMLGAAQKADIKNWLLTSKAKFKFIASSVMWNDLYPAHKDTWTSFRTERTELFNFIKENNIKGVLLLSGDLHLTIIAKLDYIAPQTNLYEFEPTPLFSGHRPLPIQDDPQILFKYESTGHTYGFFTINTTVSPARLAFNLYSDNDTLFYTLAITEKDINPGGVVPPPPPPTPDLVANHQTITINGALTAGKNLTFTSSIKNQGAGTASSGSIGRWCMDNTNCLDSTAGQINTHNFGAFNPNQISSLRTSNAWKASAGSHVIYWCADVTKVIAESDEKNNCASLAFTVAAPITPPPPPADLTTINLSLSGILQSGQTFTFTGNVRNVGKSSAPASKARFCVDSKNCLTSTAGRLGNDQSVPVLAAESESVKFSRTWLATAGEHTAFFCADVTKVIAESDEKNNCSNLPFAVSEPSPPPPPPSCDMDMVTKKIDEAGQAMQQGNFALARQRISEATVLLQKCR